MADMNFATTYNPSLQEMGIMSTRQFNYANSSQARIDAAEQLGLDINDPKVNSYIQAFRNSLNNQMYQDVAQRIGIRDYSSFNDYERVLSAISGGNRAGTGASSGGSNGSSGNTLPAPNDGSYANIMRNLQSQGGAGNSAANSYDNRQVDTSGGNPISADDLSNFLISKGNQLYLDTARGLGIESYDSVNDYLQVQKALTAQGQTGAAGTGTQAPGTTGAPATPAPTDPAAAQMQMLRDLMIKQEEAYQQQLTLQQQQLTAANAAYAEQQRQADALSRAYIPPASQTATAPVFNTLSNGARGTNTLSGLRVMGGRPIGGTSLSGLQIA